MQKFNKFSLAVFQKESVPGFPTKKTDRQGQTYSDGPYSDGPKSDTRLPDTRLKSGQGYRTYTVWMISGVALAACSGGGGGGAPAPVTTISEHHTPGIEGAQAYYEDADGNLRIIEDAVTDADGKVNIADSVANEFEIYFDLSGATTADGTPAPAVTIRAGNVDNEVASYATTVIANAADAVEEVAPVPEPAEPGGAAADPESLNEKSLLDDLIRELFDNVEAGEDAPKSANAGALQAGASVDDFQLLSTYSTETGASDTSLDLQSLNQDLGQYLDIASKAEQSNQAYLASEESETLLHLYAKRHFVIQEEYDRTGEGAEPNLEEYLAKQIYGVIHNQLDIDVDIRDGGTDGDFIFKFIVEDEEHDLDITFTKNDDNAQYIDLDEIEPADDTDNTDTVAEITYIAPVGSKALQQHTTISIGDGFTTQTIQLYATDSLAIAISGSPETLEEARNDVSAYSEDTPTGIMFHSYYDAEIDVIFEVGDSRFRVDNDGELLVIAESIFDYETEGDTITLDIEITAPGLGEAGTITTTVELELADLNELAFDHDGDYYFHLAADPVADSEVGEVKATDPNTDGGSHPVTYALGGDDAASFAIDNDGVITYVGEALDDTAPDVFNLTVTATSRGESIETEVAVFTTEGGLSAANIEPTFDPEGVYAFTLAENQTEVDFTAITATGGLGAITYSLSGADENTPAPDGFTINEATGVISYSGDGFDYEDAANQGWTVDTGTGAATRTLTVTATAGADTNVPESVTQQVTITLDDVEEAPDTSDPEITISGDTAFTLAEDSAAGALNAGNRIEADWDDVDETGDITLVLTDDQGNEPANFEILNGIISYTGTGLDHETEDTITLTLTATGSPAGGGDDITASLDIMITVSDVNEAPVAVSGVVDLGSVDQGGTVALDPATLFTDPEEHDFTLELAMKSTGIELNYVDDVPTLSVDADAEVKIHTLMITATDDEDNNPATDGLTSEPPVTITVTVQEATDWQMPLKSP